MNRDSSIIPKIIIILGFLSVLGIILLFFRFPSDAKKKIQKPESTEELFAQVILEAQPRILRIWEEGDRFIKKDKLTCPNEIIFSSSVGRSYYQCQPHFWQCYWQKGVQENPEIKIDLFGQTFHVEASPSFAPIKVYSKDPRYYQLIKGPYADLNFHYGMLIELKVREIPELTWPVILTDSCRDTYLPERIYGYGKVDRESKGEGFIWDNFDRKIFIDRFYVSNQQVNSWRILKGEPSKVITDRKLWPRPALLNLEDQKNYCAFFGKKVMEAKLFDAAAMTPQDLKDPLPGRVLRPATPWQRDLSKTFLGMARINPDYQLTPLDCSLAQVQGCPEKYFTTDSATWMGMNYVLGFFPESLLNFIEPEKNLKNSSKFLQADSKWHELGILSSWNGKQEEPPVAFRCYEEVSL